MGHLAAHFWHVSATTVTSSIHHCFGLPSWSKKNRYSRHADYSSFYVWSYIQYLLSLQDVELWSRAPSLRGSVLFSLSLSLSLSLFATSAGIDGLTRGWPMSEQYSRTHG